MLADTHWVPIKAGTNLLLCQYQRVAEAALEYLQTIRPATAAQLEVLGHRAQKKTTYQGHTRRVVAGKKTAAFALFAADAQLVAEVAAIDEALYELDRIELGRRLDGSRWMNFVELSSSARWSEISHDLMTLLDKLPPTCPAPLVQPVKTALEEHKPTDRLRRGTDALLIDQLQALSPHVPQNENHHLQTILHLVERSHRFTRARDRIFPQVPRFLHLTGSAIENTHGQPLWLPSSPLPPLDKEDPDSLVPALNQILEKLFASPGVQFHPNGDRTGMAMERVKSVNGQPHKLPAVVQGLAAFYSHLDGQLPLFLINGYNLSDDCLQQTVFQLQQLSAARSLVAIHPDQHEACRHILSPHSTLTDDAWSYSSGIG